MYAADMNTNPTSMTQLDYCQYVLVSQITYTLTNFADDTDAFRYDMINRVLAQERVWPSAIWENVRPQVVLSPDGYLVFADNDSCVSATGYGLRLNHLATIRLTDTTTSLCEEL